MKVSDRVGDLAARRRRARQPRAGARGAAARARSRGGGGDDRGRPPGPEPYPVHWISRGIPVGVRHLRRDCKGEARARGADVVYATSMIGRAALGSKAARRPLVIKLTTDEAYERAQRRGLYDGDMDEFQGAGGDLRIRALRRSRDAALRRATQSSARAATSATSPCPGASPGARGARDPESGAGSPPLADARRGVGPRLGIEARRLPSPGGSVCQKSLEVGLEAVAQVAGVSLRRGWRRA